MLLKYLKESVDFLLKFVIIEGLKGVAGSKKLLIISSIQRKLGIILNSETCGQCATRLFF